MAVNIAWLLSIASDHMFMTSTKNEQFCDPYPHDHIHKNEQ